MSSSTLALTSAPSRASRFGTAHGWSWPSSQTGRVADSQSARGVAVRAVTLDGMADELKLDRVDFIKMDIEGADPDVVPRVVRAANAAYKTSTRQGFQAYFH